MRMIVSLIIFLLIHQICPATIINVPSEQPTIQAGIDAAVNGDTVLVADGTYTGTGNRDIDFGGKNITLRSQNGPGLTVIDAEGDSLEPHRVIIFQNGEDSSAMVDGFTIQGGYEKWIGGGGIYADGSSAKIINCIFQNNCSLSYGAGLYCIYSPNLIVSNCLFQLNSGKHGGGAMFTHCDYVLIENCVFVKNIASSYGSGMFGLVNDEFLLTRCIFYGNSSEEFPSSCLELAGGGLDTTAVEYCIFAFNQTTASCGAVEMSCNNIYGNVGGDWIDGMEFYFCREGNLSCDPMFCDTASLNLAIDYGSMCNPHFNNCGLMGAYEIGCYDHANFPRAIYLDPGPASLNDTVYTLIPEISWEYYDTASSTQQAFEIQVSSDNDWSVAEMWESGPIYSSDASVIYSGNTLSDREYYYLRVRLSDRSDWGGWTYGRFRTMASPIIYVPLDYVTIQPAIDNAEDGDTVLVDEGVYTGEGNRNIAFNGKNITLKSMHGPELTIIDCQGTPEDAFRAFKFIGGSSDAVLDGFTITNVNMQDHHGTYGSAIFCNSSSPTIKNCIIENCVGGDTYGSAMSCLYGSTVQIKNCVFRNNSNNSRGGCIACENASPVIDNCRFENNRALQGGVLFAGNSSNPNFNNCLIYKNSAVSEGGVIYSYGSAPSLSYCTLFRNSSDVEGGAIYSYNSNPIIENSIIAFGSAGEAVAGWATLSYCDIYGNVEGDWTGDIADQFGQNGNLSVDPMFCDTAAVDFSLSAQSQCVGSGENGTNIGALGIGCDYICGDANANTYVNVSDAVYIINYVFVGGDPPMPLEAGDVNCDETYNVSDAVFIINYVFVGGNEPCDTNGDSEPDC